MADGQLLYCALTGVTSHVFIAISKGISGKRGGKMHEFTIEAALEIRQSLYISLVKQCTRKRFCQLPDSNSLFHTKATYK